MWRDFYSGCGQADEAATMCSEPVRPFMCSIWLLMKAATGLRTVKKYQRECEKERRVLATSHPLLVLRHTFVRLH